MTDITSPEVATPDTIPYVLGIHEREELIYTSVAGEFLPTTHLELHKAANMIGDPHAGARHIGEVFRHQVKASGAIMHAETTGETGQESAKDIDPQKAVTRVLDSIGGFARSARSSRAMLTRLQEDVSEAPNTRRSVLTEMADAEQGLTDIYPHNFRSGLPEFIRYRDLSRFVMTGKTDQPFYLLEAIKDADGYQIGDVFSVMPERSDLQTYFIETLARMRLQEVNRNLGNALVDQQRREAFWVSILQNVVDKQTSKHARFVGQEQLDSLSIAISS